MPFSFFAPWRWLAYSRPRPSIVVPDPTAPATRGGDVSCYLATADLDRQATPRLKRPAWRDAQGDCNLARSNTPGRYRGYTPANLGASRAWRERRELSLQLKNLASRPCLHARYDSGSSSYSPGDGRVPCLGASRGLR